MNQFRNLFLVIAISFTFQISYSQCGIESPSASNITCIENASYEFDLNFAISNTTLDSFNIYINDVFINRYSINQLPVHIINNLYSGFDEDVIKVSDTNNETCFATTIASNPCSCALFEPEYSKIDCTDSTFNVVYDMKHFNTNDSFEIGMVGRYFGSYSYNELPIILGPFNIADTIYALNIFNKDFSFTCYTELEIYADKCLESNFSNIELISYECDENYKKNITFSFDHININSLKYQVQINNIVNTFEFQNSIIVDSVTLKDIFTLSEIDIHCDSTLNLSISSFDNPDINASNSFTSFCCELCEIGEISVRDQICTSDSTFNFIVDFDYAKNKKDSFKLFVDNILFGSFNTAELPLTIFNFPLNNITEIIKICMDDERCCNETSFEVPDCTYFDCNISDAKYTVTYDSIGLFWITFDELTYSNTSESFTLVGNGNNYGNFKYSDLPITLGSYNCADSLEIEFAFKDFQVDNCNYIIVPGIITCPTKPNSIVDIKMVNWDIYSILGENKLIISTNNDIFQNANVKIYNTIGHLLLDEKLQNGRGQTTINLNHFKTGIYLVYFTNNNRGISKKIYIGR